MAQTRTPRKTAAKPVEAVEMDDDAVQIPVASTGAPQVAPELTESQTTGPSDLGFVPKPTPEIEVEALPDKRQGPDKSGMVEVRMARTIEEFTYGNPHAHYPLLAGKRYRLPLYVAEYLDGLEALHHRV